MAIKEEHSTYDWESTQQSNWQAYDICAFGLEFQAIKDFYIKGIRAYHEQWNQSGTTYVPYVVDMFVVELSPKTLTNSLYNTETIKTLAQQSVNIAPTQLPTPWINIQYFNNPIRIYKGRKYIFGIHTRANNKAVSYAGIKVKNYNTDLITNVYQRAQQTSINNPAYNNNHWLPVDFIADTFDYSYLVRDRKETKKIFVPTIDTDLTLSQDNLGDWSLNKLQSNNTTSISFPIFKDVKYNVIIPEGAKFCYAGTLDKKVSDFEDSETRVLNRILVDDATVTNPLELEFTALQNERGFVAYINDADAGLTPEQVTLTGTAGYELYKLTNEEGTEYEALPDFDITSEQFKNGSPLFVEPQANVLMDFAHPSVLYWQELETDNPMLQVKITATPHSQHVTGDKISLEVDGVLCDIAEMQVDSEGGAILAFSFDDKQTWVYWKPENENDVNVGEWVTITEADRFNGQSKDVTDALSPANWKLAIGDADGFYIRASFISTSQSLSKIGVKFAARDTAATTEVETEGTD